uniref:polysaccharide biosynthesis protein n=1 Tax=Endozoicomonas sp. Mp262 TaxID=2919499 RepID=UPI00351BA83A
MEKFIFRLPRLYKWGIMIGGDVLVFWSCLFLSFYIRLLPSKALNIIHDFSTLFWLVPFISVPVFLAFGLYHIVVRYIDHHAILALGKGCLVACCLLFSANFFMGDSAAVPRSVPLIFLFLTMVLIIGVRFIIRGILSGYSLLALCQLALGHKSKVYTRGQRLVVIIGAGQAGQQLLNALKERKEYRPVAFIDENDQLHNRLISGIRVYSMESLPRVLVYQSIEEILLAIPSASRARKKEIIQNLEQYGLPIRTMPSLSDIASGRLNVQEVQDVDIGDLLGREQVSPVPELLEKCVKNKVVLVTGAGGSIGSELCRQIVHNHVNKLILFEVSEYALYSIDQELKKTLAVQQLNADVIPVLGSVNDPERLLDIMNEYRVNTVYHTAAYKHVPLVEYNLSQGIRNNVMGTLYTAQAAILARVERFVLVSTDKAVRPSNVMGASKRLAEMVLQGLSQEKRIDFYHADRFLSERVSPVSNHTCFTMVRFGNVLGSSGSVIPVFREQIKNGGPVTVTHPDICRYFMTIPEAAQLVIQAGAQASGGEVFVLDMGEPVKIADLAEKMVSLSGMSIKGDNNPEGDIEIVYTGLRPGEKLYEELLIGGAINKTNHPRIFQAKEEMLGWQELCLALDQVFDSLHGHDYKQTRDLLLRYVNGYHPTSVVVDWLYPVSNNAEKTISSVQ